MTEEKAGNTSRGNVEKIATYHSSPRGTQTTLKKNCNVRAAPKPDNPGFNITGRYQEESGRFTFHVNQAGKHIECWEADVLDAEDKGDKTYTKYGGELEDTNSFSLYLIPKDRAPDPEDVVGELSPSNSDDTLLLTWHVISKPDEPHVNKLILNQPHPVLSEGALDHLSLFGDIRTETETQTIKFYEYAPLTRQDFNWLQENLAPEKINFLLHDYMEITSSSEHPRDVQERFEKAKAIDAAIGQIFSTEPPKGWHHDDLYLATHFGRVMLATNRWTSDDGLPQSHLDWIQVIIDRISSNQFYKKDYTLY